MYFRLRIRVITVKKTDQFSMQNLKKRENINYINFFLLHKILLSIGKLKVIFFIHEISSDYTQI